jgi:hypothetical protein
MKTGIRNGIVAVAMAAAVAAGSTAFPSGAAAQDDRGWRSGERGWTDRDMDRYGREQFERGLRMGRDEERRAAQRRSGQSGEQRDREAQRWEREQYERGHRLGREEERRFGRRDYGYGRGAERGEREDGGWFSGGEGGLFD